MNTHTLKRVALVLATTSIVALSACSSSSDSDVATGTLPADPSLESTVPLVTTDGTAVTPQPTLAPLTTAPTATQPGQADARQRRLEGKVLPSDMKFLMPSLEAFAQLVPTAGFYVSAAAIGEKEVPAAPTDMAWAHEALGGWERTWTAQGPAGTEPVVIRIRMFLYTSPEVAQFAVAEMHTLYKSTSVTSGVSYKGALEGKPVTFNAQATVATNGVLVVEVTSATPDAASVTRAELAAATIAARINEYLRQSLLANP